MGLKEWEPIQLKLAEKFGDDDKVIGGKRLGPLLEAEGLYGLSLVEEFHGYDCLEHAFFEFLIETLELAGEQAFFGGLPKDDNKYSVLYLNYTREFRSFRAAATLKNYDYPMKALGLLRDIKDQVILNGAMANGYTDCLKIRGFGDEAPKKEDLEAIDFKTLQGRAKKESARAIKSMVGEDSGLEADDLKVLELWRDMYHREVHGAFLSYIDDMKTLYVEKQLPKLAPTRHENDADVAMYINRSCEIGWMLVRTMPYLQLSPNSFGLEWNEKWTLLDEAYSMQVQGFADLGKKIGDVFIRLIKSKFNFTPNDHYSP